MVFMQYPQYTAKWTEVKRRPSILPKEEHRWLADYDGGKCCVIDYPRFSVRFEREEDAIMYRLTWVN